MVSPSTFENEVVVVPKIRPSVERRTNVNFTIFFIIFPFNNFIFDLEDKIQEICKTFSLKNYHQDQNLIEALKTNCRKTVKEKTGKRPYTNVNLVRI